MKSDIPWCDHSLNPGIYGCDEISPACLHCYAALMANRQVALLNYPAGITVKRSSGVHWSGKVVVDYDRIAKSFAALPKGQKLVEACFWCEGEQFEGFICDRCRATADGRGNMHRNHRVFVTSMSDLFHKDVPDDFIGRVFDEMRDRPHLTFQVLTKRPKRMWEWADNIAATGYAYAGTSRHRHWWWPENVWAGCTAEDQKCLDDRLPFLLKVPAPVRFLSVEPMVGQVNLGLIGIVSKDISPRYRPLSSMLHWVISGAESGNKARPSHPDWFRALRDECKAAGVPYFHKQNGEYAEVNPDARDPGTGGHVTLDPDVRAGRSSWVAGKSAGVSMDGQIVRGIQHMKPGVAYHHMTKVKDSGRLIDGVEHLEFPHE